MAEKKNLQRMIRKDSAAARAAQVRRKQRAAAPAVDSTETAMSASSRAPPLPQSNVNNIVPTPGASTTKTPSTFQTARTSTSTTDMPASTTTASTKDRIGSVVKAHNATASPLRAQNQATSAPATSRIGNKSVQIENNSGRETNNDDKSDSFLDHEPAISDANREIIDASCLKDGSLVMLRPKSQPTASLLIQRERIGDSTMFKLTKSGMGLGTQAEIFQLVRVKSDDEGHRKGDKIVRYGDTVVLRSLHAQRRALGGRAVSEEQYVTSYNIGCFRRTAGTVEQWMLRSSGRVLAVGRSAVESSVQQRKPTAAIRLGDCLALRNKATGGLLSLDSLGEGMTLLTHSYTTMRPTSKRGLIDRLHHHDRMLPSSDELFQIVAASSPPCPLWTSGVERHIFLEGEELSFHSDQKESCDNVFGRLDLSEEIKGTLGLRSQLSANATPSAMEKIIMDECVGSLVGLKGHYIHLENEEGAQMGHFGISPEGRDILPSSMCHLIERILVLSTRFVQVRAFVSSHWPGYDYGQVMQALCETLDDMLQQYASYVAKLDSEYRSRDFPFGINMLYVYIQKPLETMTVLQRVVVAARSKKGGALLNSLISLRSTVLAGQTLAQKVLGTLLEHSCVPYMAMLRGWLTNGILVDPAKEFMVESRIARSSTAGSTVSYDGDVWNEMFVLRRENALISLLEPESIQKKVLMTGRYWNALRLCQAGDASSVHDQTEDQLHYGTDLSEIFSFIGRLHSSASEALLCYLLQECKLSETLLMMKRYFLLEQGDFLLHFLDVAEAELLKDVEDVAVGRVQNWLGLSIQLASHQGDDLGPSNPKDKKEPLSSDSLSFKLAPGSLVDALDDLHAAKGGIDAKVTKTPSRHPYGLATSDLTGLEAFVIDYPEVPFPTSLVISNYSLESYQLLFRHLFFAKHVERRLVGIWFDHQMMKELQSLRGSLGPTYSLRQRMLHFMHNLIGYMMSEVVGPNWSTMLEAITSDGMHSGRIYQNRVVQTVDDIIYLHSEFLRQTCEGCLLTNRKLVRSLTKLMTTCRLFSDQMKRFMEKTKIASENQLVANQKRNTVQRNLNDPDHSRIAQKKKLMRKKMIEDREDRARRLDLQTARVERELSNESYKKMIARYDEVFSDDLRDFIHLLQSGSSDQYKSHWLDLCARLDYNGYGSDGKIIGG